jgi:hypothetical protein
MNHTAVKFAVSIAIGLLLLIVGVYIIGISAALATPSWLQSFAHAHPTVFFWVIGVVYVSLPLAILAILFGAVLGRVIRSRAVVFALLCAMPWLVGVVWSVVANSSVLTGSQWIVSLPDSLAVVAGVVLGMRLFGFPSRPDQAFRSDAVKATTV